MSAPLAAALYSSAFHLYLRWRPVRGETHNVIVLRELRRDSCSAYPLPSWNSRVRYPRVVPSSSPSIGEHMSNILKLQRIESQATAQEADSLASTCCGSHSGTSVGCGEEEPQ